MTTRELLNLLDKAATLTTVEGLEVQVKITDARSVFGRQDIRVEGLAGEGTAWVSSERVRVR